MTRQCPSCGGFCKKSGCERDDIKGSEMNDEQQAAIEYTQRGEPVATRSPELVWALESEVRAICAIRARLGGWLGKMEDSNWKVNGSGGPDDLMLSDLNQIACRLRDLQHAAPQPAEPVNVPSAHEINQLWIEVRHQDARTQTGHILAFARTLLSKYASPQPQQQVGEPLFWYRPIADGMYEGPVHNNSVGGKMLRDEKPGEWKPLYGAPQPQQIPEGYKLVPVEPTAQDVEGGGIVEAVTKAILFEDCGSAEDWQDNLSLGEAALRAVVAHMPVEMGAAEWAELHILRAERGPSDGVHKTWKDAAIAERCNRVLMAPRKEIIDLAKEGLSIYTGPNMNEHKICAEIVRLSAMLEAAPELKGQ